MNHCWQVLKNVRQKFDRDDDFEGFLFVMAFGLFALLFVRILVALYMGRWGLFE